MQPWTRVVVATLGVLGVASIALGVAWPDGVTASGDPVSTAAPSTTASSSTAAATAPSSPTPTTTAPTPKPGTLAPLAAADDEPVPGLPSSISIDATDGTVHWCDGTTGSKGSAAAAQFGTAAVRAASCSALTFLFEQRYSALAVPRSTYTVADFHGVRDAVSADAWSRRYRPVVKRLAASPATAASPGLVLLRLATPAGTRYYTSYAGRAVWIDPRWTRTAVAVDRRNGYPRLQVSYQASAQLPVWSTSDRRDDMMRVDTTATFFMVPATAAQKSAHPHGLPWRVDGWQITTGDPVLSRLKVAETSRP